MIEPRLKSTPWADVLYLLLGIGCATLSIKGFLMPSSLIDGGVMGISLMIFQLTQLSLPILVFAINLPFILLAYRTISPKFATKSILGIGLLSLSLLVVPVPDITEDKILVATFGGIFLGAGIGFAIRGGGIIDGTEVLAIWLSRKTNTTVGTIILLFNLVIFGVAAYVISVEIALYAILTYYVASRTVDFIIDGVEEYIAITIISQKASELKKTIMHTMGHGCTLFYGQTGLSNEPDILDKTPILYTVMTRLEISKLKAEVEKIDPNAFLVMTSVKDTKGGMVRKRVISKIH